MRYELFLGDCLEIIPELGKIDAVISDPPYGINFNTNYGRFTGGAARSKQWADPITNDDRPFEPGPFLDLAPVVILWGANNYLNSLTPGTFLVWDKRYKGKPLMTSDAEVAWCNKGHGVYVFNHYWDGFMKQSERGQKRVHPTQKPVALMEWCINKYTKPGDTVLDPFMGSGTTGVACANTGRNFIGIEIMQEYFKIAENRISNIYKENYHGVV